MPSSFVVDDSPIAPPSFHATSTMTKNEIYLKVAVSDCEVAPVRNDEATEEGEEEANRKRAGYWALMKSNGRFRLYILSYAVTMVGEWFTYVSSLAVVGQIHASRRRESRTSISILVALRLIPGVLFSNIGGVLADSHDRRKVLIALAFLGSIIAWLFVLSHRIESLACLYAATFLQMTVASVHEPTAAAIVPMMVTHEEELKKAVTAIEMTWGVMTSVGSALGGFSVDWVGIDWCFAIDSLTYLISGMLIFAIRGEFVAASTAGGQFKSDEKVAQSDKSARRLPPLRRRSSGSLPSSSSFLHQPPSIPQDDEESTTASELTTDTNYDIDGHESISDASTTSSHLSKEKKTSANDRVAAFILPLKRIACMAKDGFSYLRSQPWRSFIFIKVFASFIYGAGDVLNVSFAEHEGTDGSNRRLGIIFASVGAGCFIGPLIPDRVTRMDNPASLKIACLASFYYMGIGWLGLYWYTDFDLVCVFSAVRAGGSTIAWIYSTLLVQHFCSEDMLGRVMSIDLVLAMLGETSSAVAAGVLEDHAGLSAEQVSLAMALIAFATTLGWGIAFYFFNTIPSVKVNS